MPLSGIHALIADALRRAPLGPEAQAEAVVGALKAAGYGFNPGNAPPAGDVLGEDDWRAIHQAEVQIVRGQGVAWASVRARYPK
ncbi:MAG: hypothetical protein FJX35_12445 [Alphaproteobacteria bacterium]|nr:hypothetical protein [Alphaproteobacteria bacterium]